MPVDPGMVETFRLMALTARSMAQSGLTGRAPSGKQERRATVPMMVG
ncbi:hypothetical protein OIU34_02925 [Pararhizobium sp. BT-229]|nr:hypothetical protein [Pararhizobium sp. BT-229]MCV9960843.1 hypothetical protein [Pararhizobium sp. BT-229]